MSLTLLAYTLGMQVTAIVSALGTLALAVYSYRALRNARSGPSGDAHGDQQPGAERRLQWLWSAFRSLITTRV